MNYQIHYNNLIETRKLLNRKRNDGNYYEKHHIIPKCLGGTNDEDNLVLLTGREHFVAHLLLAEMYTGKIKRKMAHALWRMCHRRKDLTKCYRVSAREYEKLRKFLKESMNGYTHSEETKQKIRDKRALQIFSQETLDKRSASLKKAHEEGRRTRVYKPLSEEHKKKLSEFNRGKIISPEMIEKLRQSNIGRKASEETLKKMSESQKGKVISEETRKKISESQKKVIHTEEWNKKVGDALRGRKKVQFE